MTAASRLYLFGVIAENAVLPWLSSGRAVDSENRRIQNVGAAATVLAGEVANNRFSDPGTALKSIAEMDVHGSDDLTAAKGLAFVVDAAVSYWFNALKLALALFFVPVEYLNGSGDTDSGTRELGAGQEKFLIDISALIGHANPDPHQWSGPAADKYQTHNTYQRARMDKMAAADGRLVTLLTKQGAEVEAARKQLAAVRLAVTGAIGVASVLLVMYVRLRRKSYTSLVLYQKANSMGWALVRFIQVSLLGMVADVIDVMTTLGIQGTQTKNRINNVIEDGYRWVIDDWGKNNPAGTAVRGACTAAPATALPSFADLLDMLPAVAASADEAETAIGSRQHTAETPFVAAPLIAGLDQRPMAPSRAPYPAPARSASAALRQVVTEQEVEEQAQQPAPAASQLAGDAAPVLGAEGAAPVGAATAAQA